MYNYSGKPILFLFSDFIPRIHIQINRIKSIYEYCIAINYAHLTSYELSS